MSPRSRRLLILVLLLVAVLLLLLLARCTSRRSPAVPPSPATSPSAAVSTPPAGRPASGRATAEPEAPERLGPATLEAPARVLAGASFEVRWTGPDNDHDYVSLAAPDAPPERYLVYGYTRTGPAIGLTAPVTPAGLELRYVTGRSKTVLARRTVEIYAAEATLEAPAEATAGTVLPVGWTGPNNAGDFVTIVPAKLPDGQYGNHEVTARGSPLKVLVPIEPGDAELRYMTGQGQKVLARRALRIVAAPVSLAAPEEAVAGSEVPVEWTGPKNHGDFITIVPASLPDGRYGNHTVTSQGSPMKVLAPMDLGGAEIRYMTGQGAKVLARRPLRIVAGQVSLAAPEEVVAGTQVSIDWQGPKNQGDYLTVVPASLPDGRYGNYTYVAQGSPLKVLVPIEPGAGEIRYMSGQGAKVLARRPVRIVAATVTLDAPPSVAAGAELAVSWTGPNNAGDYVTVVTRGAKEGTYLAYAYTSAGSPARVKINAPVGEAEIRYVSGQGARTLARRDLRITRP